MTARDGTPYYAVHWNLVQLVAAFDRDRDARLKVRKNLRLLVSHRHLDQQRASSYEV